MEPNVPSQSGGPSPEAGPALPQVEAIPGQVELGTIESAPQPAAIEVDRPSGEGANQNQGMMVANPTLQPVAQPVVAPQQDDDSAARQLKELDAPGVASDVDVIEKEWVDKAKQIVRKTVSDPYAQNHNVSVLKADYMKKRYGKDIKIPDDKPAKV